MSLIKDPDLRRKEQLEKSVQANKGFNWAKLVGFGDLGGPPLSAAEDYSLHSRHLAKANSLSLSEIAEMKIMYVNYHFQLNSFLRFSLVCLFILVYLLSSHHLPFPPQLQLPRWS